MLNFSETLKKRLMICSAIVISFYIIAYIKLDKTEKQNIEELKIIENVEFLELEEEVEEETKIPEPPKNVWEKIKSAFPVALPEPEKEEKPLDVMKEILRDSKMDEMEKLEDRKDPLLKSQKLDLDALKKERDSRLNELMDMTGPDKNKIQKLLVQEQALVDAEMPLPQRVGIENAIEMEEVGLKRADDIADVITVKSDRKIETIAETPTKKLVEKKMDLKKRLAALSSLPANKLQDRKFKRDDQLKEIAGTVKQRRKAQELLALQNLIDAEEPAPKGKRKVSGAIGFGTPGSGRDSGRISDIAKAPVKKKKPVVPVVKKMKNMKTEERIEITKKPVEITGPLEHREVMASFVPPYPDWAKEEGIEADVAIRFYVNAQGIVDDDMMVTMTSGYSQLDALCKTYLKRWKFAPLGIAEPQVDQWGIITMRFRLE
ncbi:TonB family protein [Elusimicrobiota bacterium]